MLYGISKNTNLKFEEAVTKVTEELKKEGFGVLTTIDVKETLKNKLNVDFKKYVILGACNPPFAYEALQAENEIGLFLPCNIIVYENTDGSVTVSAFDPAIMSNFVENDKLRELTSRARQKLERVMNSL